MATSIMVYFSYLKDKLQTFTKLFIIFNIQLYSVYYNNCIYLLTIVTIIIILLLY